MAEWTAVSSCADLQLNRHFFKPNHFLPANIYFSITKRKHCYGRSELAWLPIRKACDVSAPIITTLKGSQHLRNSSFKCWCFGALINPDNSTQLNWIPLVDRILLMTSVVFAYMAGALPTKKDFSNTRKNNQFQEAGTSSPTSGSEVKSGTRSYSVYVWDEVKAKLVDALDAIEHDNNLDKRVESEREGTNHSLSLNAVAEGPRLRLLWAALQQLQSEVKNISGVHEVANRNAWFSVLSETIKECLQSVCLTWLENELYLAGKEQEKVLLTRLFERLKGDGSIIKNIQKLGKDDLYADLLFFLRFGTLRLGCQYDNKLLTQHGVDILEDLLITLADGIACMYLELISVDSNMSAEITSSGLIFCSLSTRALQRLRNEVSLNQWMHLNIESVVSMYEDRFDLFVLGTHLLENLKKTKTKEDNWWKKLTLGKRSVTSSTLRYALISHLPLAVKRTSELRALTGWRYYFSLFLEFSDIAMPLARVVIAKISSGISFFLVSLIGRSLGLIYTGIREALRWK